MSKLVKSSTDVAAVVDMLREITEALDAEDAEADSALAVRVERKSLFDGINWDAAELKELWQRAKVMSFNMSSGAGSGKRVL